MVEQTALIAPLTASIVEQAVGDLASWRRQGLELGVAVKTVENHKIRVFEKLGVRTQAQAITVAMSFGLTGKDSVRTGRADQLVGPPGWSGAAG